MTGSVKILCGHLNSLLPNTRTVSANRPLPPSNSYLPTGYVGLHKLSSGPATTRGPRVEKHCLSSIPCELDLQEPAICIDRWCDLVRSSQDFQLRFKAPCDVLLRFLEALIISCLSTVTACCYRGSLVARGSFGVASPVMVSCRESYLFTDRYRELVLEIKYRGVCSC
jgi:hypothetical protein